MTVFERMTLEGGLIFVYRILHRGGTQWRVGFVSRGWEVDQLRPYFPDADSAIAAAARWREEHAEAEGWPVLCEVQP